MSARLAAVAAVAILVAACGSSKHSQSTGTRGRSPESPSSTRTAPRTGRASTTTLPSTTSTSGAANVRLPATFTIRSGGALSPPTVTAPAGTPIELTLVSGDRKHHQAVLRAPQPRSLSVPAGGMASVLVTGLGKGRYPLEIDGVARAELVVGGQPGP